MDDCFEDAPPPMDPVFQASSDLYHSPKEETTGQDPPVVDAGILRLYDKAFSAFLRGNHREASRVMAEALPHNDSSAIFHLMNSLLYSHLAMVGEDLTDYRNTALESTRRAIRIAPQHISVALFYAHLRYDSAACSSEDYENVDEECDIALAVEGGFQPTDNTPEARITSIQNKLRSLMQKAKDSSSSQYDPILEFAAAAATVHEEGTKKDERRKEIEAQLLLQMLKLSATSEDTSSGAHRRAQRLKLKMGKKSASSLDHMQPAYDYWRSVELEKRESFLEIAISDLRSHFSNSQFKNAYPVLTEALSYAEKYQSWKFWLCCKCRAKFSDSDSLAQHLGRKHMPSLPPNLQSVLPQEVDGEAARIIIGGCWKPVDMEAAAGMLVRERSPRASEIISEGDSSTSGVFHKWPLSIDEEKSILLEGIRAVFQSLLEKGCLTQGHLNKMMHFTLNELRGHPPTSGILSQAADLGASPMSVCFLGASGLRRLLQFWQELAKACEFEERRRTEDADDFPEERFLIWDSAKLRLDKLYFASTSGDDCWADFIPWLFLGPSLDEQITEWAHLKKDKRMLANQLRFQMFSLLRTECAKKRGSLSLEEALQQIRRFLCEKAKKEANSDDPDVLSFDLILSHSLEEPPFDNAHGKYVADIIPKLIEEAKTLWASYFLCEDIPSEDFSAGDDEVVAWDALYCSDNVILTAIQRFQDKESWELCKKDARILRYMNDLRSYGSKLSPALSFDYRLILVPLMREFMRSRLEGLAEEYAVQKSEAASEAFLAELALDEKSNVKGSEKRSKAAPEKSKDKKKRRSQRKSQDSKAHDERAKSPSLPEEEENPSVYTLIRTSTNVHRLPVSSPYLKEEDEDRIRVELEADAKAKEHQRKAENKTTQKGAHAPSLRKQEVAGQKRANIGGGERKAEEKAGVCRRPVSSNELLPKYVPKDEGRSCARPTEEKKPEKDLLNALILTLWHSRRFSGELLCSLPEHSHVGYPCVVCSLQDGFTSLDSASTKACRDAVSAAGLRTALRNLFPDNNLFEEMNDAAEVLATIFDCIHRSFTGKQQEAESEGNSGMGSWDCSSSSCIAHRQFGWDVLEKVRCSGCGVESRRLKYTSFFHDVSANDLRKMKDYWGDRSLDELLRLVEMEHQLSCDREAGGCGKLNHIRHILHRSPKIFTLVLAWKNAREKDDDISATLDALSPDLDVANLYHGLKKGKKHSLVGMVCCFLEEYVCFAYRLVEWVIYEDRRFSVIGKWGDVLSACKRGRLQPQILFFEVVE